MNIKTFFRQSVCIAVLLSIAATVMLASCSDDDTPGSTAPDDGNAIRFTTAIASFTGSDAADNSGARATINDEDGTGSFANGDETTIMGFVYEAMPPVKKESPATYKDGMWTTTMTWDEFGEGAHVAFSAFFPKLSLSDFSELGQMAINLPTDQSTTEQYADCDWLHAAANGKKTDQPIQLTFRHCMHRLTVNLSLSDNSGTLTQADVDAATVVIKNMETKGVVSFSGGVMPQAGNTGDFTPLKSTDGNSFRVLLLPQNVTPGTPWIEITVSGRTVTYPVPEGLTELEGGKEKVVNLKLTNDSGASYLTYLTGWYRNDNYDTFVYTLVNDAQTVLSPPAGGSDAYPKAMVVSGGKTYVSGGYFDTDGWARACYWVNGSATKLEVPDRSIVEGPDYSESILVSGGKIYIAGSYNNNDYRNAPCYWVDGVLTTLTLPAGASEGAAASIAVLDGKIYAVGYHANSNGTSTPGYWLDGSFVQLSLPEGASFWSSGTMDIVISDNKVYVMGTYFQDSRYYPCVWIDGTRNELVSAGLAALGSVAQSMTVAGGKVYVSGYSIPENRNYRKGCYWVDGVRTDLSVPDGAWSEAASIGVIGGKVYVGGEHYTDVREKHPCYWVDGVRTDLDIPTGGTSGGIRAIYLSE